MATGAVVTERSGTPYRRSVMRGGRSLGFVSVLVAAALLAPISPLFADVGTAAEAAAEPDASLDIAVRDEAGKPVAERGAWLERRNDVAETVDTWPWELWDYVGDAVADEMGRLTFAVPIDPSSATRYRVVLEPDHGDDEGLRELVHEFTVDAQGAFDHGLADVDGRGLLTLVMRGPNVSVRLVAEDGSPLAGLTVVLQREPDDEDDWWSWVDSRESDVDGRVVFDVEPPAQGVVRRRLSIQPPVETFPRLLDRHHDLVVDAAGHIDHGELSVDEDGVLVLVIEATNLDVRLVDGTGTPVPDATVWIEHRDASVHRGGWEPASGVRAAGWQGGFREVVGRTDAVGVARFRVQATGDDLVHRFRLASRGSPSFAHRFLILDDDTVRPARGERLVDAGDGRLTLALWSHVLPPGHVDPPWLVRLNEIRADADLAPLTERPDWNRAARQHSHYAARNSAFAHAEDARLPGHSLEGRWATETGNLYGASPLRRSQAIDAWLRSPGHAGWMLHWDVSEVGFGAINDPGRGGISVLPITGSYRFSAAVPDRHSYPADGGTMHVDTAGGAVMYLFDHDLAQALAPDGDIDGRLDVVVRVDGATVDAEVSGAARAEQFTIRPAEWIPAGAEVDVQMRLDGQLHHRWSFATVARVEEPRPSMEGTFPDAPRSETHHPSIEAVAGAGIAGGFADGNFRPDRAVTRGQMAAFLMRAFHLEVDEPAAVGATVTDIVGTTHEAAIEAVIAAGIASGFADGTFRPEEPVTRGQMATFLARALVLPNGVTLDAGLVPPDIRGTAHEGAIEAVIDERIAGGFGDGTYRPGEPVTRGQMATFLFRALLL